MDENKKPYKICIDTGGTFTDCIATTPKGEVKKVKILSSSSLRGKITKRIDDHTFIISNTWNVNLNLFTGYEIRFLESGFDSKVSNFEPHLFKISIVDAPPSEVVPGEEFEITANEEAPILAARIATGTKLADHLPLIDLRLGTTKGTNALLERKGARVTFITTKGFKDLITIGTQQRPDLFALHIKKTAPLYFNVIEIEERINADGEIICPMAEESYQMVLRSLEATNPETIAIAFINSYKNDTHELALKKFLERNGYPFISISSEMAREIKILPRAQTTIINAYIQKILQNYLTSIQQKINTTFKVMTSYGGLIDSNLFLPKDSLLSGPAGGIVGAFDIGKRLGREKLITFDMGGTSTDVSRVDEKYDYQFETEIDNIPVFSPVLAIETVAAGGGSICSFDGFKLTVGPESAGASPGPACYGAGGPLAITDVNLLLGRLDEESFGIPINKKASEKALDNIIEKTNGVYSREKILGGFLRIANEKMADAIRKISLRKGHDPAEFTLLAFGGAGGQNACALADLLSIDSIIVPFDAGLLSAYGMGKANIERFAQKQLLQPLEQLRDRLPEEIKNIKGEAIRQLAKEGFKENECTIKVLAAYMRFKGQETCLEIPINSVSALNEDFQKNYESLYGHWIENETIEVESIKIVVAGKRHLITETKEETTASFPKPIKQQPAYSNQKWVDVPVFQWENLSDGNSIKGPALLVSQNSTVFIEIDWTLEVKTNKNALLTRSKNEITVEKSENELAELELFTNRFKSVAEDMGAILQRSSFSVNVKERLDFSCGVLDPNGFLIANAPHIPVHLGSLGICVRSVLSVIKMEPGDVVITNHPAFGGSHLPDITLISGAFDLQGKLIGYVANRAHHAEVGGKTPGSMPPDAINLIEEGVIIPPSYLIKNGKENWREIRKILTGGPYPTRSVEENIADLNGALASIKNGVSGLTLLVDRYSLENVHFYMEKLQEYSANCVERSFSSMTDYHWKASEKLDDGTEINVQVKKREEEIFFDFTGTSLHHPGNLNATEAILTSAIIYVLRLMVTEPIPLNEGIIRNIKINAPRGCFLNPDFPKDLKKCPAVVGGNTETSQRVVDTLIKALGLAACSQGTMNNFIFGNEHFGFYETICGGTGAGEGFDGTDAVHQHMTNTRITDPEVIEYRYPVRLERMEIRKESGGDGKWKGGNGVIREITFLDDINVSMLTQHRVVPPYGSSGGSPGKIGEQIILTKDNKKYQLAGIDGMKVKGGDRIIIKTPGGGGWGAKS